LGLAAEKCHIDLSAHQRGGELGRGLARECDFDAGLFLVQDA
jgi:hypothetical protein